MAEAEVGISELNPSPITLLGTLIDIPNNKKAYIGAKCINKVRVDLNCILKAPKIY
jgi:hypothetical protein